MCTPLPYIAHAYSLVIQDEKQAKIQNLVPYPANIASFVVLGSNSGNRKPNNPDLRGPKGTYQNKKNSTVCEYCKKIGHTIDKYYRLHGFPPNFKFTKQKQQFQQPIRGNACSAEASAPPSLSPTPYFTGGGHGVTQDHVAKLIQLLKQVKFDHQGGSPSDGTIDANCVGISFSHNCTNSLRHLDDYSWILDSGTTEHMTFNRSLLYNIKSLHSPVMVNLPNSYRVKSNSCWESHFTSWSNFT